MRKAFDVLLAFLLCGMATLWMRPQIAAQQPALLFSPADVRKNWLAWWQTNQAGWPTTTFISEDLINHFVAVASGKKTPQYQVELNKPLLSTLYGNQHICDIRANAEGLEVAFAWDHPANRFSFARVPWRDIRLHQVEYGLPEHYDPSGLPAFYQENPLSRDPLRNIEMDRSHFAAESSDLVGTKKGEENEVYLFQKHRIVKARLTGETLWEAKLPQGHTLIAFDVSSGLLWIVTNSDLGAVDGELTQHFLTTQVFAVSPS